MKIEFKEKKKKRKKKREKEPVDKRLWLAG